MKKSKKDKNKYDNVVINRVELTPTTIGEIEENENSIVGVLAIFGFLIVIIFVMPYFVNWLNGSKEDNPTPPVSIPSTDPSEEEEPITPPEEVSYISLASPVSETISGYRYEITVNYDTSILETKITNVSGSTLQLVNNPTYIELYTEDKTLLDRILIDKQEIVSNATISFNFLYKDNTNSNQKPAYLVIESKNINDYPAITLTSLDASNLPFLTCTKDNETLVYTFQNNDKGYFLSKINDNFIISNSNDEIINTYEVLTNSYNSIDGVTADISPRTSGFSFETEINLNKVKISERKRILSSQAYYEKNTEAKTIYFELNASGYKCN